MDEMGDIAESHEEIDICPRCGGEINLSLPHGYDRELDAPVHRQCEASE